MPVLKRRRLHLLPYPEVLVAIARMFRASVASSLHGLTADARPLSISLLLDRGLLPPGIGLIAILCKSHAANLWRKPSLAVHHRELLRMAVLSVMNRRLAESPAHSLVHGCVGRADLSLSEHFPTD